MRITDLIKEAEASFPGGDAPLSRKEAERLLCRALGLSRLDLVTSVGRELSGSELEKARRLFSRRRAGEPIQYVLGEAHFRELTLEVGSGVLIPRPETELLAGKAIELATGKGRRLLDVGTGSGAIALSIAAEAPDSSIFGVDVSQPALSFALRNLRRSGCRNARFAIGDLSEAFAPRSFDIITANLPYISADEIRGLPDEVARFEPMLALSGGEDGLSLVRRLVLDARRVLNPGGWLLLEIGAAQADAVVSLIKGSRAYGEAKVLTDFCGRDRVVMAKLRA